MPMTSTGTSNSRPNIIVTEDVMKELNKEALRYPDRETACGVVGLIYEDGTIALTGTIPAPALDVVRNVATAQLGGKDLKAAYDWLHANFGAINHGKETKVLFAFIGKAHSHQKIAFHTFSSTDEESILEAVRDLDSEVAVWPLLLISEFKSQIRTVGQMEGTISVESDTTVRVRFYYLDKKMVQMGRTKPILIQPKVVKSTSLPALLPPLSWRHTDEDNFRRQLRQLDEYGAQTFVIQHNADSDPEHEVQFVIVHPKWNGKTVIIVTDWDYPKSKPVIKVVSPNGTIKVIHTDIHGAPIWQPKNDFIDILFELVELKEI
jgi:hypothetical protein